MGNLVRITEKEVNCFFGYYDKYATDKNDRIHLFHQVDFFTRPPVEKDKAKIGICEIETGKVEIVDETYAWNFQQGSMLQFLDDERIVYNYREKEFIAKIYNLRNGKVEFLPKAVSALSPDGKYAVGINFSRLAKWRPGYGYEGLKDRFEDEKWPEKDGIYIIDVEQKKAELIIPLSLMLDFRKEKGVEESYGWFNHTLFSPSSKRFIFLNRWKKDNEVSHKTRLFTSDIEGKEIYDLLDAYFISHFAWKNEKEIIVWAEINGERGFWILEDKTGKIRKVSDKIQKIDGHCSYSKDEKIILYDTYPIDNYRYLKLFYTEREEEKILGKFYSPPEIGGEIRCDLHPRWSRSEKFISFDSLHEGFRGVYIYKIR